jgi:hypothetical protein
MWGLHRILTKLWVDTTAQVTPRERQSGRCLTTILPVSNWALDGGSASCVMFCLQPYWNRRKRNGKWRRFLDAVSHGFNVYTNVQPFGDTNFRLLVNMTFRFLDSLITIYISAEFTAFVCSCNSFFYNFSCSRGKFYVSLEGCRLGSQVMAVGFQAVEGIHPPQCPDRLCGPPSFISVGYRVKFSESDAGHSPPSCAEIRNAWRFTSTLIFCISIPSWYALPPLCHVSWRGIDLRLPNFTFPEIKTGTSPFSASIQFVTRRSTQPVFVTGGRSGIRR